MTTPRPHRPRPSAAAAIGPRRPGRTRPAHPPSLASPSPALRSLPPPPSGPTVHVPHPVPGARRRVHPVAVVLLVLAILLLVLGLAFVAVLVVALSSFGSNK